MLKNTDYWNAKNQSHKRALCWPIYSLDVLLYFAIPIIHNFAELNATQKILLRKWSKCFYYDFFCVCLRIHIHQSVLWGIAKKIFLEWKLCSRHNDKSELFVFVFFFFWVNKWNNAARNAAVTECRLSRAIPVQEVAWKLLYDRTMEWKGFSWVLKILLKTPIRPWILFNNS